jgi:isopentenyl diphosphate isomerase/L-lactate dehydrogenase-like FMN-dependent dehydrogenase
MADLSHAFSIEDLRRIAKKRLPQAIFDFFDGGAEDEVTLWENRAAFERVRLLRAMKLCGVRSSAEIGSDLISS